jgi:radial spoke head protein 9
MNVKHFRENLNLLTFSGFTLTEAETELVENSLIVLQSDNKFRDIFFWGKIQTITAESYYVAFGYSKDILRDRKFFYSLNGHEWVMMPEVKPKLLPIARKIRTGFRGDPAHVYETLMVRCQRKKMFLFSKQILFQNPTFLPDKEKVFLSCHSAVKKIKEDDRLACVVQMITQQSAIIPRGILYRQVTRCVTYNPCFRGLNRIDASLLKNFQLFRFPLNNRNYNVTKRDDYNYQTDFLDAVDDLIPANSLTVRVNDRDICMIRSLKWLGMFFVHKLNTIYQGFVYFGTGQENLDLLFMLSN